MRLQSLCFSCGHFIGCIGAGESKKVKCLTIGDLFDKKTFHAIDARVAILIEKQVNLQEKMESIVCWCDGYIEH